MRQLSVPKLYFSLCYTIKWFHCLLGCTQNRRNNLNNQIEKQYLGKQSLNIFNQVKIIYNFYYFLNCVMWVTFSLILEIIVLYVYDIFDWICNRNLKFITPKPSLLNMIEYVFQRLSYAVLHINKVTLIVLYQ